MSGQAVAHCLRAPWRSIQQRNRHAFETDFTKLGANVGYVTVYPSGVNGWNIGSHDMYSVQRRTSNADDVGFFRMMFDELVGKKIADPARIYLVGGSNSG